MKDKLKGKKILNYVLSYIYSDVNGYVENINKGGCGVFAEQLYHLFKGLGLEPQLVVISKDEKFNGYDTNIAHVIVRVNGYYIDTNGIFAYPSKFKYYTTGFYKRYRVSIGLLEEWNKDTTIWATYFNRKKDIPVLVKKVAKLKEKINTEYLVK